MLCISTCIVVTSRPAIAKLDLLANKVWDVFLIPDDLAGPGSLDDLGIMASAEYL